MTTEGICEFGNAALADPAVDLAMPLALHEGLGATVLTTLPPGDYHPSVGDVPGSLTYRGGGDIKVAKLSTESELLLSAYLDR
ncbi:hypothetical protein SALBM311S_00635 [Streptomyces alboniger]